MRPGKSAKVASDEYLAAPKLGSPSRRPRFGIKVVNG